MTKQLEAGGLRLFEEWGIQLHPGGDVITALSEQDAMTNAAFPRTVVVRWATEWEQP